MSAKTGRPLSENPKSEMIKIRMDKSEVEQLRQFCADNNLSMSEAIRQGLILLMKKK